MRSGAYLPPLDGLRAVSILLVLAAHAGLGRLVPGGLGVTIFFFVSGFLITGQLADEHARSGGIALGRFWLRRALRLLPVAFAYVAVAGGVFTAFGGTIGPSGWLAALFYGGNVAATFSRALDSDVAGLAHPFSILWSLAVEEHFYLVWPPLLALMLARRGASGAILFLVALAGATLAWRCHLAPLCASPSHLHAGLCGVHADDRIYKSTDTRIDSIAYGALAALLPRASPGIARRYAALVASRSGPAAAILLLLLSLACRSAEARDTWRCTAQGMALLVLVPACLAPGIAARALATRPLVAIGRASYGLYLWHWLALMVATRLATGHQLGGSARLALFASLTALLTLASWHAIERPMLRLRRRAGSHVPLATAPDDAKRRLALPAGARRLATLLSGSVSGQVVAIALSPLLARLYGMHAWGGFGIFTALATLAASVACLGFEPAILLARDEGEAARAYGTAILLACGTALLALLASLALAPHDRLLLLVAPSVLMLGIGRAGANRALALDHPRAVAAGRLWRSLGIGAGQLALAFLLGRGAASLALGAVLGQALACAATVLPLGRRGMPRFASFAEQKRLVGAHASLLRWSAPQTLLNALGNAAVPLILARVAGTDLVGAWTLAQRFVAIPAATLGEALRQNLLAAMARNTDAALLEATSRWSRRLALVLAPCCLAFALLSRTLFALAFGPHWSLAADCASLLLAAEAAGIANIPAVTAIVVRAWQRGLFLFQAATLPPRLAALALAGIAVPPASGSGTAGIAAYAALSVAASAAVTVAVILRLRSGPRPAPGPAPLLLQLPS